MEIIIQSLGFTAGGELESYVHSKLEKFNKADNIIRANVVLFLGPDGNPQRNYCEIRLEIPGNDLFVKRNAVSFEAAILSAAEVLQKTIRKSKEKLIQQQRGS